jgi:hypothetical protein
MEVYDKVKGFFSLSAGELRALTEFEGKKTGTFQKNLCCPN